MLLPGALQCDKSVSLSWCHWQVGVIEELVSLTCELVTWVCLHTSCLCWQSLDNVYFLGHSSMVWWFFGLGVVHSTSSPDGFVTDRQPQSTLTSGGRTSQLIQWENIEGSGSVHQPILLLLVACCKISLGRYGSMVQWMTRYVAHLSAVCIIRWGCSWAYDVAQDAATNVTLKNFRCCGQTQPVKRRIPGIWTPCTVGVLF